MSAKSDLLSDGSRDRVRAQLQSYIHAHWPKARFRWITADNTDDLDMAVDLGNGERFVRVSFEAALEVPKLKDHLDAVDFIGALDTLSPKDQVIVATTGLHYQPVAAAFR